MTPRLKYLVLLAALPVSVALASDFELGRDCASCHHDKLAVTHHSIANCTSCHDGHQGDVVAIAMPGVESCRGSCHDDHELGVSHPSGDGIVDTVAGGELTCVSTCHSIHDPKAPMLLQFEAMLLYYQCHSEKFGVDPDSQEENQDVPRDCALR
jgi:hypothetical protein